MGGVVAAAMGGAESGRSAPPSRLAIRSWAVSAPPCPQMWQMPRSRTTTDPASLRWARGGLLVSNAFRCTPYLSPSRWPDRNVPDFLGIFADCAVGGEPAHVRRVKGGRLPPSVLVTPAPEHRPLGFEIAVEVGGDHKIVVMRQHIDETSITVGLVGRENTRADRVENLGKFDRPLDCRPPVDSSLPARLHFLRRESKNKDVFPANSLADLDISAVKRSDGQCAVQSELHVARARCFYARRRDLLRNVGRRNDSFGEAHIVIG